MPLFSTDAIVLHAFDYLESSRVLRLATREAGVRSAIAKGARRSTRRFGGGLDLFLLGGAWRIVAELGFAPTLDECASCHAPLAVDEVAMFSHPAGGALCTGCARL